MVVISWKVRREEVKAFFWRARRSFSLGLVGEPEVQGNRLGRNPVVLQSPH